MKPVDVEETVSEQESFLSVRTPPSVFAGSSKRAAATFLVVGALCALAFLCGRNSGASGAPAAITPGGVIGLAAEVPSVQASWDNHFAAFGTQDVPKIKKDYTDKSVVSVWDLDKKLVQYKGLDGVTDLFKGLFKILSDTSGLKAPVIKVDKWEGGGMVFLVWLCPTSGLPLVTDTFIFDKDFKILRQNIVNFKGAHAETDKRRLEELGTDRRRLEEPSVQASWDNHFAAFGKQDVPAILKDYTESSVVRVYDFSAKKLTKYEGLDGVKDLFTGLFKILSDTSGLKAPVAQVEQWEGGGMVFLVWKCPTSGLPLVTDSFIFDKDFKILRQNIVSWPA